MKKAILVLSSSWCCIGTTYAQLKCENIYTGKMETVAVSMNFKYQPTVWKNCGGGTVQYGDSTFMSGYNSSETTCGYFRLFSSLFNTGDSQTPGADPTNGAQTQFTIKNGDVESLMLDRRPWPDANDTVFLKSYRLQKHSEYKMYIYTQGLLHIRAAKCVDRFTGREILLPVADTLTSIDVVVDPLNAASYMPQRFMVVVSPYVDFIKPTPLGVTKKEALRIVPNVAVPGDRITLTLGGVSSKEGVIQITSVLGQTISQTKVSCEEKCTIPIPVSCGPGIYIVSFISHSTRLQQKILVR